MPEVHSTSRHWRFIDLTGQVFAKWTVISYDGQSKWLCRCACGTQKKVDTYNLRAGHSKGCRSCSGKHRPLVDLVGQRFGRLLVSRYAGDSSWVCQCDCGKFTIVPTNRLSEGKTKSCGCLNRELTKGRIKHGCARVGSATPEFRIWQKIKERCYNVNCPAYPNYGGRGIVMCDRWREDFSHFLADMGKRPSPSHSIDRINNDKGYEPSNCRWATPQEQSRNRRHNRLLTLNGQTKCVAEWADEVGINQAAILGRLKMGWTDEQALTRPLRRNKKRK